MKEFIIYLIQSSTCLSVFILVYLFLLRGNTFLRFNRIFLLLGLFLSFIIPSIQFSYDVIVQASQSIIQADYFTSIEPMTAIEETNTFNFFQLLIVIYLIGASFVLCKSLIIYIKLRQLKKEGKCIVHDNFMLISSQLIETPFSFFNTIYINDEKLQEKEKEVILKHEISHVEQKHWIDLLCAQCALVLQWINPLMWYYIHLMKENHEYLADRAVLENGESITVYRAVLINQRFQGPIFSFTNSFNYSKPQNRLTMMKKTKTSPWRKLAAIAVLPFIGAFLALNAEPNYVINEDSYFPQNLDVTKYLDSDTIKTFYDSNNPLLYILDGKEITNLHGIDSIDIEYISVLQDKSATDLYGEKGKNGVVIITSKENEALVKDLQTIKGHLILHGIDPSIPLLYILDDKEITTPEDIDTRNIANIQILDNELAEDVYGEKGKNGVVLLTSKKLAVQEYKIDTAEIKMSQNFDQILKTSKEYKHSKRIDVSNTESAIVTIRGQEKLSNPEDLPIYILDGEEIPNLQDINPDDIESISVLKDKSATNLYGKKGKKGVVLLASKKNVKNKKPSGTLRGLGKSSNSEELPLYILDGEEIPNIEDVDSEKIAHIKIIRDQSATDLYGEKGKNGVVLITSKKKQTELNSKK